MGLIDSLLNNPQQQQDLQQFVQQYQQGSPSEGYSAQQVANTYQQVAPQLSSGNYMQAAEEAFHNMSPQERQQFGQYVEQQVRQQGVQVPGFGNANPQQYQDPHSLAQAVTQIHKQQPGLLSQLLSGATGGGSSSSSSGSLLENPAVKGALAGIAAMAVKNALSGQHKL